MGDVIDLNRWRLKKLVGDITYDELEEIERLYRIRKSIKKINRLQDELNEKVTEKEKL